MHAVKPFGILGVLFFSIAYVLQVIFQEPWNIWQIPYQLIKYWILEIYRNTWVRFFHYRNTLPPKRLQETRPRRLSCTLEDQRTSSDAFLKEECTDVELGLLSRDHQRSTSSRLLRLPLEIREQIWSYVLGPQRLHIILLSGERCLCTLRCRSPELSCGMCGVFCMQSSPGSSGLEMTYDPFLQHATGFWTPAKGSKKMSRPKHHLLSLALTCRQTYRESIDMLYSEPDFEFMHPVSLIHFAETTLVARQNMLRRASMRFMCQDSFITPNDLHHLIGDFTLVPGARRRFNSLWEKAMQLIKQFKSLQELELSIMSCSADGFNTRHEEGIETLLQPAKTVKAKVIVDVICSRSGVDISERLCREHGFEFRTRELLTRRPRPIPPLADEW